MQGMVIPTNWSSSSQTPIGFLVDDAQNLICAHALNHGFEWILLIEDDTLPPPDMFVLLEPYVRSAEFPIVSGLYFLKTPGRREPLIYRGRGTGPYTSWMTPGWDKKPQYQRPKLFVDGVPTGCLLVHTKILEEMAKIVPDYELQSNGTKLRLKRIFNTPRMAYSDQGSPSYQKLIGTSDLYFCDTIMDNDVLTKAGWKGLGKKRYPFLVDTAIVCGHIERTNGQIY